MSVAMQVIGKGNKLTKPSLPYVAVPTTAGGKYSLHRCVRAAARHWFSLETNVTMLACLHECEWFHVIAQARAPR